MSRTNRTILVVDDMAIFRDPIAASLRLAGYETLTAEDGEAALRVTRDSRPALVLLDVAMPRMDGLTYLKHLRADPAVAGTRVILLTAVSEKSYVMKAVALGVNDYLLKSRFRLKDLLDRIARHLTPEHATAAAAATPATSSNNATVPATKPSATPLTTTTATSLMPASAAAVANPAPVPAPAGSPASWPAPRRLTREECIARAEGAFQAKTLSGVVVQVIALANSPRSDTAQLAALIARDPMLSARVLQAANTAAYASNCGVVTTIADAIRKVGCATVRNVAAALGVFDVMPETSANGFNPIRCWQHSFAVARLCEHLALASSNPDGAGLAYVVGLCHDLAEIFIHTEFHAEYRHVLELAALPGSPPAAQLERDVLGMTHADLVKTIFGCIGLPESIREPVEILHAPGAERTLNPTARILYLAEQYANGIMLASSPASTVAPLSQALCRTATGSADPTAPDAERLRSEVLCLTATLSRLPAGEQAKLFAPLLPRRDARIWLARDAALSSFDPIEAALRSLAEVSVHNRLPTPAELAGLDGCVAVTRGGAGSGGGSSPAALAPAHVESFAAANEAAAAKQAPAGRPLPFLWISATRTSSPPNLKAPVPVSAPVALADLAAFVETAAARQARAAAA